MPSPGALSPPAHRWTVPLLCALLLASLAPQARSQSNDLTAIPLDQHDVELRESARRAWFESLHRAAPGVDWRELEAANREISRLLGSRPELASLLPVWTEVGSRNVPGKVNCAALRPSGARLVGTDNAGLFEESGAGWAPRGDQMGHGVHELVVCPGPPETWLACTHTSYVKVSTDAGVSWSVPAGLPDQVWACQRLLRDASSPSRLYLLLEGQRWVQNSWQHATYLCRSEDGGLHFTLAHTFPLTPRPDIWISRLSGGVLYAMVGDSLQRSTDLGATFSFLGSASLGSDRAVLSGSEASNPPALYAALHSSSGWRVMRTQDLGASFQPRASLDDFTGALCASARNSQLLFVGGVNAYRSTDGGSNFVLVNDWSEYYSFPQARLHADIRAIQDVPGTGNAETWYFSTDGGLFQSTNGGASVSGLTSSGLGNAQYYDVLTSKNNPWLIAAGSQDQGYQIFQTAQGTPYMASLQVISGDYAHLTSSAGDHNMLYSVYPTFILLQPSEGSSPMVVQIPFPPATGGVSFLPFILASPSDPGVLYFCADRLWKLTRVGPAYSYQSSAFPQDFRGASGRDYLTALAISPANANFWYAATNEGRLWYSRNSGQTWTQALAAGPPAGQYFYGSTLLPSWYDPNVCFAGGSGYSIAPVWITLDGGATWNPLSNGLPSTLVYKLQFDGSGNKLFAATEAGPFLYSFATGSWAEIRGGSAPLTSYWGVESVPALGVMRFSTFGRGIWDLQVPSVVAVGGKAPKSQAFFEARMLADGQLDLRMELPRFGHVRVELFNLEGARLEVMWEADAPLGETRLRLRPRTASGAPLPKGVYFALLQAPGVHQVQKFLVVR